MEWILQKCFTLLWTYSYNFKNETNQYISKIKNAYNIGVDIIGFMPRTLEEILENKQKYSESD